MYRIKYNDSTIFDPYDDDEVVTDAKLTQEINAAAYLDFTISPKHPLYDTVKERDGVVTLEWLSNDDSEEDEKLFEGIIDAITIDFYGYKSISCVSAMDYLNDTIVRPYSTVAGEQALTAPSSIEGYFQWLIDQHNSHVIDSKKRFGVGINQGASMRRNNFIYRSSTNNTTTSEEISNQILESLGGYLVMRYENDNNVLDLYSDVHEMNAQVIDFGVNLLDFTKTIDTADQYTALIPQGGSPTFVDGGFEDDDSVWTAYPYLNISTDQKHGGEKSAYFTEGNGEFINKSFFYVKSGYRYKATVWVKNERSSSIKVYPRYQVFVGSQWEARTPDGVNPLEVPNDDKWHEFTFDFLPSVSDTTKIRGCWVFDTVTNDNNKRVYVDDFNFVRIQGENELEEDPITVAQMGDGTTPFSYDIIKHGDVIYSMSAVQRYGYREKVFSDDTITDEDALMEEGIRQLNKCIEPTTGIDIKAVDLAMYMKGYTHLQVGQAVRIRSALHDTDEYLMVTSVNLDLQDPSQTEYELGMAYDSLTGKQSSYLQSLNANINSSLDAVASIDQASKENAIHIGEVESIANDAQNTANNAQNTANSNKEAIDSIKDAQTEYEKQLEQMKQGVADAEQEIGQINDRIEGMNSEIESAQSGIEAVRTEAQRNFETAKSAADAAASKADAAQADVDALRSSTATELQNVKDSVSNVQSDVADALRQASDLAEDLDATKATVEQTVTEFGEVKTTATNAASKADQSLRVSTEASQTATQASQTATSAYEDSQKAITQSSQAVQTANQVSLNLSTNYQTKADADAKYATQASLTATSSQIKAEVSETYATKATVEGLENIANNAVQTWMGSGVPTLSNKPASDWTTAELKAQHSGDIYYDSDTGYSYRFGSSDGKNYSWALIKDTDISKAIADAAAAQETANEAKSDVTELNTSIPITYATKTELTQTSDSITSRVEEVAQAGTTTSNKVSQLEQTASGLQSTVKEQSQKLDQQATTISQVSQRVDSVSSTITQVSGRVDGVEDTADEALSKSSQLSQDLSGFKTSVQQTYETKQDALSKQSQLQQTINGFRTEVSEEYTTKDEFNALEIGGTNLLPNTGTSKGYGTSAGLSNLTVGTDDIHGEYYRRSTTGTREVFISSNRTTGIADGEFTVSFWYRVNQYVKNVDVFWLARSTTSSADYDTSGGAKTVVSGLNPTDNTWTYWSGTFTAISGKPNGYIRIDNNGSTTNGQDAVLDVTNLKLERGNKATAWSPAPEDFDGKYTSKTEFAQTTESIKATAQSAASNASSALSKVSSLEVSVDGIDAKVEENASDIADAVKTTSQVSQRVDSLTSTITQVSDNVNNMQIGGTNLLKLGAYGFNSAVIGTSYDKTNDLYKFTVPANATTNNSWGLGLNVHKGKSYVSGGVPWQKYGILSFYIYVDHSCSINIDVNTQAWTGSAVGTGNDHDTNRSHSSFSIPANQWTQVWSRWQNANTNSSTGNPNKVDLYDCSTIGVLSTSSAINVQIKKLKFEVGTKPTEWSPCPADVDADVDSAASTAGSALSKASSVEQSLNSFKTSVQQTYETKTDALNKQSSLQQSVNNLRTEVSETYTTKNEFDNLEIGGRNLLAKTNQGVTGWSGGTNGGKVTINKLTSPTKLVDYPQIVFDDLGSAWKIAWYNPGNDAINIAKQTVASAAGQKFTLSFDAACGTHSVNKNVEVSFMDNDGSDRLITFGTFSIPNREQWNHYELTGTVVSNPSVQNQVIYFQLASFITASGDYLKICNLKLEKGGKATAWSPAPEDMLTEDEAAQTYSTKSYVDQTARTVSLGVVEEYKDGQHGSALATQSDITATKNSITQTVSQTYLSKTDATNTYLNKNTAASTYATKTEVKQTSDSLTVSIKESLGVANAAASSVLVKNGDFESNSTEGWTFTGFSSPYVNATNPYTGTYKLIAPVSGSGSHTMVNDAIIPVYQGQKFRFRCALFPDNTISNDLSIGFIGDNDALITSVVGSVTGGAWHVYSAVITVPSGVKSMRARIATNNDSFVNLRVDSITVTDVTEGVNAQSTANTANSNAQNAQNRVGTLETCIKMTSDGVRVGKISNGNFTGYSALVNSAGSFDILNGSGNAITKFTTYGMEIPSNNNGNSDGKFVLTSAGYDLSFVKNGTTYYFRLGSGGIGIHASDGSYADVGSGGLAIHTNNGNYVDVSPNGTKITSSDGSYITMSKGSGFALDSKAFGMLRCGSGGLQFTNDQGWGFNLAVNGWSIKWAGNHMLATGDEPGALYIDGRKIQVA